MDFLKGLNAQQREAVSHIDGPLLILAGAGSGKTRVITHRIAHIITARHVPPSAVLAVTFTNKAAREMREARGRAAGRRPAGFPPNLSTFHSFCVRMLRRDGDPLARIRPGFTRRFSIYDDDDQLVIVKAATARWAWTKKSSCSTARPLRISHAKNTKVTPADLYKAPVNKEDRERWPPSSSNTRRRCTTPTRSISTTCCWRPCACCSMTTPPAKPGTGA
jgi:DNA helicase-2/ATP-dependent DNA helicase PcrA